MDQETYIKFEKSAKLELSEAERGSILAQTNAVLGRLEKLDKVDTKNAAPLVSVLENQKNILRADEAKKFCTREELLKRAPEVSGGCFVVPKAVE